MTSPALGCTVQVRWLFFAGISHELHTPLTVIRGESQFALCGADRPPEPYKDAVRSCDRPAELAAKDLALLEFLMSAPGKVFSRERIPNSVWGYAEDPLTHIVDAHIRRLRSKIEGGDAAPLIKTLRGIGYRLDASGG